MADFSDILSVLMQNPALMQGALSALSGQAKLPQTPPNAVQEKKAGGEQPGEARPLSLPSPVSTTGGGDSRRSALLRGVRPYLKESTCARMDAALSIISVLEKLSNTKDTKGE